MDSSDSSKKAQQTTTKTTAKQLVRRWRGDPTTFAKQALGVKKIWSRQRDILTAVAEHDRVAVRSGHKVSKSTSAAIIALWWIAVWADGRVVMTSSGGRQVKDIIWREVRRLYREAPVPLGGKMSLDPATGLKMVDGREIVGFSTKEPEKIAGYSGPHMLFIIDEASGVPEEIFEALEGNRAADGTKIVMFSNPTQTSGTFYDAFHTKKRFWYGIHISSEESPNVTGEMRIPGLAGPAWIAEKVEEWKRGSSIFAVRVLGEFPSQGTNTVITLHLVSLATNNHDATKAQGRLKIGVDVARFGDDDSVIRGVRGHVALRAVTIKGAEVTEVAGAVLNYVRENRTDASEIPLVKVDVIGVGAGVADILRESDEVEVADINVSESATATDGEGKPTYSKLRDQLWFGCADWLTEGGTYEPDDHLDQELVAPIYTFDSQGRRKVSGKDEIKKIIGRSPDQADALCLAIYDPPAAFKGAIYFS